MEHVVAVQLVERHCAIELESLAATDFGCEIEIEKILVQEIEVIVSIEDDIVFSSGVIDSVPWMLAETTLGVKSVGACFSQCEVIKVKEVNLGSVSQVNHVATAFGISVG